MGAGEAAPAHCALLLVAFLCGVAIVKMILNFQVVVAAAFYVSRVVCLKWDLEAYQFLR